MENNFQSVIFNASGVSANEPIGFVGLMVPLEERDSVVSFAVIPKSCNNSNKGGAPFIIRNDRLDMTFETNDEKGDSFININFKNGDVQIQGKWDEDDWNWFELFIFDNREWAHYEHQ